MAVWKHPTTFRSRHGLEAAHIGGFVSLLPNPNNPSPSLCISFACPQATKERLLQCITLKGLPTRTQSGAKWATFSYTASTLHVFDHSYITQHRRFEILNQFPAVASTTAANALFSCRAAWSAHYRRYLVFASAVCAPDVCSCRQNSTLSRLRALGKAASTDAEPCACCSDFRVSSVGSQQTDVLIQILMPTPCRGLCAGYQTRRLARGHAQVCAAAAGPAAEGRWPLAPAVLRAAAAQGKTSADAVSRALACSQMPSCLQRQQHGLCTGHMLCLSGSFQAVSGRPAKAACKRRQRSPTCGADITLCGPRRLVFLVAAGAGVLRHLGASWARVVSSRRIASEAAVGSSWLLPAAVAALTTLPLALAGTCAASCLQYWR